MNTPQPPVPVSHTAEMIIATVFGVMYALKTGDYFVGVFLGILAGVVLSVLHTWIVLRRKRD